MLVCRTAGRQIDRTVILSCSVSRRYVDEANLPGLLKIIARSFIPLAAILMPAGFFLSMISPAAETVGPLIVLTYAGAVVLALGVVTLRVGLLRRPT